MDAVRLGVIGCGKRCTVFLNTVGGRDPHTAEQLRPFAERTSIRGLCDIDTARAEQYRQTYGGVYATDDVKRIFSDPEIDAVLISTWHDTHGPFSLRALESGKHVLIEKPMAMTEQQCDAIEAAVERTGLAYMPAFRARFAKGTRDVAREIPQPDNVIAFARTRGIWAEDFWAQDPVKGGGQILSQACHIADLMLYLVGAEPESVHATGGVFHHSKPEPFDTINASVRFANGSVGAFLAGDGGTGNLMMHHTLGAGCEFFVLAIQKGRSAVVLDHGEHACFESSSDAWIPPYRSCAYGKFFSNAPANGQSDMLPTFARAILAGGELPATARDGAIATRFILKCFESARTGNVVAF